MDISKHPLLKMAVDVLGAIEQCGASPELTNAAIKASELANEIEKTLVGANLINTSLASEAVRVIRPTVGRVVHYWPTPDEIVHQGGYGQTQPFRADVLYVTDDRHVNLRIIGHNGTQFVKLGARLMQPEDSGRSSEGGYCEWMEYQVRTNRQ